MFKHIHGWCMCVNFPHWQIQAFRKHFWEAIMRNDDDDAVAAVAAAAALCSLGVEHSEYNSKLISIITNILRCFFSLFFWIIHSLPSRIADVVCMWTCLIVSVVASTTQYDAVWKKAERKICRANMKHLHIVIVDHKKRNERTNVPTNDVQPTYWFD